MSSSLHLGVSLVSRAMVVGSGIPSNALTSKAGDVLTSKSGDILTSKAA